jgi:PAS domain S-box-containing protein
VELSRYLLEPLREDGEFVLYRAHAKQIEPRFFLVVSPVSTQPSLGTLDKIDHEYSLRSDLDAIWAVRPLAVSAYNGKRVLVLEDPGGEPLHRLIQGPMKMRQFFRISIGLATALSRLHKGGLIHKDIKPANVLVNPATDEVRLMGFGIASRLPRERQAAESPELIAGTLAYMAPEQTGRMNRSTDSRSDLYALGVTLYEMLTGSLPFAASDPMEWVHCHIARLPRPPSERTKDVPAMVSAIIMKLLAKTAEERYQTAVGLERDLRRCLEEWETQHRINEFVLGEHDIPDRLVIPEKLYGRASEIETLLAAFDRIVGGGRPELVLVSGYSGIGKSSVVNELHKPLVPPRGLFASGKFDQYKRDIPYATLAQAFQSLLRPLLSKSAGELGKLRDALHEALDPNGQLIVDLVPELKLIIGEQPPVPEVPPQDAQRRFHLAFRRFISVFARPEHPLALFLDDLQWLDAATLDLLEDLLTQPDVRHLMLICAYRDNEVNSAHPLIRTLEAIRQAGAIVQKIVLAPLAPEDLALLIADSVHCELERATPLAQLIHEKTAGNPFFAIQFISALAEEELLKFDNDEARWSWDLNRIYAKGYTDNLADLMVGKLNRLPVETQSALQQLACLGNSTTFAVLTIVYEGSSDVHSDLQEAVRAGLVFRSDDSYRLLHDRVREAAYSLIPEKARAEAHLRIGRLLSAHTPPEKREEKIFEIVNQLNRGAVLVTSQEEREQLAELNLIAGKRAKASTAYTSALKYLTVAATLLTDDSWELRHELTFALELHRAECEFLTGESTAAEERLTKLSSRATNTVDQAAVACLRMDLYTTLAQSDRAVDVGLEYLRHLGVEWSAHPTEVEARREYERIWSHLGSRPIEELIDLPLMSDSACLATLDVLTKVVPPGMFRDANFGALAICRAVNLSLEHGNSDGSCFAYVYLGMLAGPQFGNYKAGFRFGLLGYELVERRGLRRFQARTYMLFGSHVMPWTKHVRACRDLVHRTIETANKIGDLTFAAYSRNNLNTNLLAAGDPLAEVQRVAEEGLEFARAARFGLVIDIITGQLGLIRTLGGKTPKFGSFDDSQLDEIRFEHHLENDPAALPECFYWIRKLQARFLAEDYASALEASLKVEPLLWTAPSNLELAEYHLYGGLCRATLWDSASSDRRQQHFQALVTHQSQLEIWAENCPENFENRAALVAAEIARIEGRVVDAEDLYEKAIRSAHANGFIHNEAVAYEVASRFYAARGLDKIADTNLREARYWYHRWGADGKVRQLNQLYPHIKEEQPATGPTSTIVAPTELLDLATVIKVSQAASGEIVLEKLIDKLMRAAIEHAGAERGLLILPRDVELQIEAEATTSGDDVIVHLRDASTAGAELPESLVRYVVRTQENVILEDALSGNSFSADPYIVQHRARSILCLPLINQAKLIGVLYLENNLTPHVFTTDRITVLKVLASQAAVSLENTGLYRDLENREAKIRRLVEANVVGIAMWNLEGAITGANEAFLRMVQYDGEDLASGRVRWTDLTPAEWCNRDERAIAELKASGVFQPFKKEYFRKDGSRVPVLVGGALFKEGGNEGVAFAVDLSEQRRAEEQLVKNEQRTRLMLDEALDAVVTMDAQGVITGWNTQAEVIFGWSREEAFGRRTSETIIPERLRKEHDRGLRHFLATGEGAVLNRRIEMTALARDGREFPVELSITPLKLDNTWTFGAFIRDITERKRGEEALRKAFEEIRVLKDQLYRENLALRDEVDRTSMFEEIVGTSKALNAVLSRIAKVAPTDSTVFITGETGTGKELIARGVHKQSQRSGRAFVSVNCAALAPTLISSELFGHEKGAFTGATQRRLGRFELADGGTIFLDEVGELPSDTQVALLRVLQEREFERVGGEQPIKVDVRVIAATNRDLEAATSSGIFRRDLFYRLNVFPVKMPPLRERKDDILMLLEYFLKRFATKAHKNFRSIDKKTLELLQSYEWPGNIRELQNVVERSVVLSSRDVFSVDESWLSMESSHPASRVQPFPRAEHKQIGEREMIEAALAESRGRVAGPAGAAAKLGIPPTTLYSRIKALKIRKSQFKFG